MKKITLAVMTIAGLVGVSTAFAADNVVGDSGWYALGAVGQATGNNAKSTLDNALTSAGNTGYSSSMNKPTAYKLQAGYQINKNLAVEGGYIATTHTTYIATGGNLAGPVAASGHVTGWNLTAVGILPLANQFSLLGKLGVAHIRDSASLVGTGVLIPAAGYKNDFMYGVGAKYDFTNAVFGRFDWDSYKVGSSASSSRSNVWTIGAGYKF